MSLPRRQKYSTFIIEISSWILLRLHDRRVYVLGLCLLLSLPASQRPSVVEAFGKDYIPTLLVLFNGLKRAYAARAQNQADSGKLLFIHEVRSP